MTGKRINTSYDVLAPPLKRIVLGDVPIDVWQARLDLADEKIKACADVLSPAEHRRANDFHFERDRRRFVAAKGMLRMLLSEYLNVEPAAIGFGYGKNGKPFVAGAAQLDFNLSHSDDRVIYAISRTTRVGVDIESLDRRIDYRGLAKRFFTSRECAELLSLPESERKGVFLTCWTRKEAVMKATGDGWALAPHRFEITVAPDVFPRVLQFDETAHKIADWALYPVNLEGGYAATVASLPALRTELPTLSA